MIDNSSEYLKTSPESMNSVNRVQTQKTVSYGNYIVFFKYRSSDFLFAIGPHWYVSVIGFTIIALVGGIIMIPLWNLVGSFMKFAYLVFYTFSLAMYLIMFLKNPGIIPQKRNSEAVVDLEQKNLYECKLCLSLRSQNAYHCEDCDVCIEEYDHHCIWVGKCVGKGNIYSFYMFVASIPAFFIFVMFMSCFISLNLKNNG